jgi:hypothetical protein
VPPARPKVDNYNEHELSFEEISRQLDAKLNLQNLGQSEGLSPTEAAA